MFLLVPNNPGMHSKINPTNFEIDRKYSVLWRALVIFCQQQQILVYSRKFLQQKFQILLGGRVFYLTDAYEGRLCRIK